MVQENLTNEQLVMIIQEGGDCSINTLEELWNKNLGVIQIYVKKYSGMAESEDLTQEAYFALYAAAKNYCPGKSTFSSYLGYWLSSRLLKYCRENQGAMRIPEWKHALLYQFRKEKENFEQSFAREPTFQELQELLGISREELDQVLFLDATTKSLSLSSPIKSEEGEEITLEDTIPAPENMEEEAIEREFQEEMKKAVHEELDKLPPEQKAAINLVYFDGLTLQKAGAVMEAKAHQVQGMIVKGFNTLRAKPAKRLRPYIRDEALTMAYRGSFRSFKERGASATERAAFRNLGIFLERQ